MKFVLAALVFVIGFSFQGFAYAALEKDSHSATATEVFYTQISTLIPGQTRYSSRNVEEKIAALVKSGDAVFNQATGKWTFKYYDHLSAFPIHDSLPVVKTAFGYLLADGHHHVMSSLAIGAEWLPVHIIGDFSDLSFEELWLKAEKEGMAYLYQIDGTKAAHPPASFHELQEDPNRYFAAVAARKLPPDNLDMKISKGAAYPLWIKIGKDVPFIEFKIADVLYRHHLTYAYEMGNNVDDLVDFVEAARMILTEDSIPELKFVPSRTYYMDVDPTQFDI